MKNAWKSAEWWLILAVAAFLGQTVLSTAWTADPAGSNPTGSNPAGSNPPTLKWSDVVAEKLAYEELQKITWQQTPGVKELKTTYVGDIARLTLPDGLWLTGFAGADKWLEMGGYPQDKTVMGLIIKAESADWGMTFLYRRIGHVSNEDKDSLDINELLKKVKQDSFRMGFEVLDWLKPPFYNRLRDRLLWATKCRERNTGTILNRFCFAQLCREGVLIADAIAPADSGVTTDMLLKIFDTVEIVKDKRYGDWKQGNPTCPGDLSSLVVPMWSGLPDQLKNSPDYKKDWLVWKRWNDVIPVGDTGKWKAGDGIEYLPVWGAQRFLSGKKRLPIPKLWTTIKPVGRSENEWFAIVSQQNIGYVRDDDKKELTSSVAIMQRLQANLARANEEAKRRNVPAVEQVGWHQMPAYDAAKNRLTWALKYRFDNADYISAHFRVLGRKEVIAIEAVVRPDLAQVKIPEVAQLIDDFKFAPNTRHGDFREGDKTWSGGLVGLLVGDRPGEPAAKPAPEAAAEQKPAPVEAKPEPVAAPTGEELPHSEFFYSLRDWLLLAIYAAIAVLLLFIASLGFIWFWVVAPAEAKKQREEAAAAKAAGASGVHAKGSKIGKAASKSGTHSAKSAASSGKLPATKPMPSKIQPGRRPNDPGKSSLGR